MAISDIYTARVNPTLAATGSNPQCSLIAGTTVRLWLVGVRVIVGNTAAVSGNDIHFTLCRPGNTPTGTTTAAPNPHDFSAPASIGSFYTAWSTAPTVGAILAEWDVPMASGSDIIEYPPTGYEWQVPALANTVANTGLHVFTNPSVGTSTPVYINLIFSQ